MGLGSRSSRMAATNSSSWSRHDGSGFSRAGTSVVVAIGSPCRRKHVVRDGALDLVVVDHDRAVRAEDLDVEVALPLHPRRVEAGHPAVGGPEEAEPVVLALARALDAPAAAPGSARTTSRLWVTVPWASTNSSSMNQRARSKQVHPVVDEGAAAGLCTSVYQVSVAQEPSSAGRGGAQNEPSVPDAAADEDGTADEALVDELLGPAVVIVPAMVEVRHELDAAGAARSAPSPRHRPPWRPAASRTARACRASWPPR